MGGQQEIEECGKVSQNLSESLRRSEGGLYIGPVHYQYFQKCAGRCEIRLMVAPDFTEQDRVAIERAYKLKVGEEVQFKIKVINEISLTALGKLKMLDLRLNTQREC